MKKTPRAYAVKVLLRVERDASYSNLAIDSELKAAQLDKADSSFLSALCLGVIERKITLDYNLSLYLSKNIKKLKPEVLTILRLGAYQILFMERIPSSAAVNESVRLASDFGCSYASGLINAVLRRIAENGIKLPHDASETEEMSVRFSVPEELAVLLSDSIGLENTRQFLECSFGKPDTTIRINTLKTDSSSLIDILSMEGIEARVHPLVDNSLIIDNTGSITRLKSFADGLFHVQDASSQLCIKELMPKPETIVFDICSSPGGKSYTAAQYMNNTGTLYSFDLTENRLSLVKSGCDRLGITNMICSVNDGTIYNPSLPQADSILCDVPCSGLGIIGKKPEIRYKPVFDLEDLYDIQYSILSASAKYLKTGGTLVYSTCTVNCKENSGIIKRFLDNNQDFKEVKILPDISRGTDDTYGITLLPHINGCDGFYICKLVKD